MRNDKTKVPGDTRPAHPWHCNIRTPRLPVMAHITLPAPSFQRPMRGRRAGRGGMSRFRQVFAELVQQSVRKAQHI